MALPLARIVRRAILHAVLLCAAIALPFVVLVRGAVYFYADRHDATWLALASAACVTVPVVALYAALAAKWLTGRFRVFMMFRWVAIPLVVGYAGFALLYLGQSHAKSAAVRSYYASLDPIMRVAVSTVTLVDHDLVITDLARTPEDYDEMGLPRNDASLHFPQADGYVHAMDLRTLGRPAVENWLVNAYFRAMGFATLRHVGTADHLHVALPVNHPLTLAHR
jgi:hypothetical protein